MRKAEKASIPTFNWINKAENRKAARGFTLLELSAVLFMMAVLLGISLPNFSNFLESDLEKETKRIAAVIEELRLQAILERESYRLVFNTKDSAYHAERIDPENPTKKSSRETFIKSVKLPSPVELASISTDIESQTPSKFGFEKLAFEKIFGQEYQFIIDSSGFVDQFRIRLKDRQHSMTLTVTTIMGEIEIGQETPL